MNWLPRFAPLGLLAMTACAAEPELLDRGAVFAQLGDQVIVPPLQDFAERSQDLLNATEAFCGDINHQTLDAAQASWRATRKPWSLSRAAGFGPVEELGIESGIDFWPARRQNIENTLVLHDAITPETIDQLGVSAKGLPAIEYLLFAETFDTAAVLATFPPDPAGELRCAYLVALTRDIRDRAGNLLADWERDGGHLQAFKTAGDGSTIYPTHQDAVDILVNTIVAHLTYVVDNKLDKPLTTTGDPVELLESRFCDCAAADLRDNLAGLAALYSGGAANKPGLHTLVAFVSPALDQRVSAQIVAAQAAADAITGPLRLAIGNNDAAVQTLRDEVDALRRLFKTEVVSALGVTLVLSDNDGD